MRIYIAAATVTDRDYGSLLGTRRGIWWTDEYGTPCCGAFEEGRTVAEAREKVAALATQHGVEAELVEMPEVGCTVDINPHGLM
jgi:hypothetical protein